MPPSFQSQSTCILADNLLKGMDGIPLNEVQQPIWAEEHAGTDLYVIDTAVEDVIAKRLGAYSEYLRGFWDIEQALKLLPARH